MISGALIAVLFVLMYGLIAWGILRGVLRRHAWSYTRATFSPLVLSLVFVSMFGSAVDRSANAVDQRREATVATDQAIAAATDPIGKKLAGQSKQMSEADQTALSERGPLGERFGTVISRVLANYNDEEVTANAWIASTRKNLSQADRTLSALRQRTNAVSDEPVAAELRRLDRRRTQVLAAFSRLLGVVTGPSSVTERSAQNLVDRRLSAFRREAQRLIELMMPYLTDRQRSSIDRAVGA